MEHRSIHCAQFQSTPSAWRETRDTIISIAPTPFQSTPSAWRETPRWSCRTRKSGNFNPLPPHGGRQPGGGFVNGNSNFNPLPPHGGRQMTFTTLVYCCNFNPLPPHGGRRNFLRRPGNGQVISIHSLRMEGDDGYVFPITGYFVFQSTPSAWRETLICVPVVRAFPFQSTPSAWRETVFDDACEIVF